MATAPKARAGHQLEILKRPLAFSYWPTYQGTKRIGLQSSVFALDPWTIINSSVKQKCPSGARQEALAFVEQARDFYTAAASAAIAAARPLLLYYCFLNLAKALVLRRGAHSTLPQPMHGLKERLRGLRELEDAFLRAEMARGGHLQVFDEFLRAIRGVGLSTDLDFDIMKLLPQILPGHRLWAEAANQNERFVAVHEIRVMESTKNKTIWLEFLLFEDDLTRLGITHKKLLQESRLNGVFRQVRTKREVNNRRLIRFEQIKPLTYIQRPSDMVLTLVSTVRDFLWVTVASVPPYRRYYLYLSPQAEHGQLLPQLISIYAITFYLGSITRYRPHHFDRIVDSAFGPRIEEFISGQPLQFIYLMASEFAQQDVTKPSIV
jgi:YaaC-like Protein